jgi:hypothetical protein
VWEKSGYNTVEWVRYITRAGSYEIRCWDFILSRFWRIVDANRVFLARKSIHFPSHCYNGHTWGSSFLDTCMSQIGICGGQYLFDFSLPWCFCHSWFSPVLDWDTNRSSVLLQQQDGYIMWQL